MPDIQLSREDEKINQTVLRSAQLRSNGASRNNEADTWDKVARTGWEEGDGVGQDSSRSQDKEQLQKGALHWIWKKGK